ncbi:MAG: hypothetical protein ACJARS_005189, partial [bacterium]
MNRRTFLAALSALSAVGLAPQAYAFGDSSDVDIAELDIPGTVSRPNAWKRLLYDVVNTTSVA